MANAAGLSLKLFQAVLNENLVELQKLLEEGADPNVKSPDGDYPILAAVRSGNLESIKLLLENGADVNQEDKKKNNVLQIAIRHHPTNIPLIQYLLENGADVNHKNIVYIFPLYTAIEKHDLNLLKLLIEHGADIHDSTGVGHTPLLLAIVTGDIEIVKFLLENGANCDQNNGDDYYPIHAAAQVGHLDIVKLLLDCNEESIHYDQYGETPLFFAIQGDHLEVVKFLLEKGAECDIQNSDGYYPIHLAAQNGYLDIVKLLLVCKEESINYQHDEGTPLFMAANGGYTDLVKFLLEKGADSDIQNSEKYYPIHTAAQNGYLDIVKLLLDYNKESINYPHSEGTPLFMAARNGDAELVTFLLQYPTLDKNTLINGATILKLANNGKTFHADINKLIIDALAPPKRPEELWKGFTKADAELMNGLFEPPEYNTNHPNNISYAYNPIEDLTYCPICLGYVMRKGEPKEKKGCMYMHHDCRVSGAEYNEELYEKYKGSGGIIWWCTICNRICKGHQHYNLGPPNGSIPPLITESGSPFDASCKQRQGGGGVEEKVRRILRLREVAKELNDEVGKISKKDAVKILTEEMWLAGMTERRNAKRVAKALEEKKFNIVANEFAPNTLNNKNKNKNKNYRNVTRSAANLTELRPELSMDQEKWDPIALDELKPAILFNHRKPDGTVVKHKKGMGPTGEDGEWLGVQTVEDRLNYYVKNFGAEDFGLCPLGCGARIYPDEVKDIVPTDLYEDYRRVFNRRFAAATEGGKRRRTRRIARKQRKQRGGEAVGAGIFHTMDDAQCVRPWTRKVRRSIL